MKEEELEAILGGENGTAALDSIEPYLHAVAPERR